MSHGTSEMTAEQAAEMLDGDVLRELPLTDHREFTWGSYRMVSDLARDARQKAGSVAHWASCAGVPAPSRYRETADALAWITNTADNFRAFREAAAAMSEGAYLSGAADHDSGYNQSGFTL